jgi:SHAQKYF class myb-like DNA-binding protein
MSLIESESLPTLFLGNFTDNIFFPNNLSDNNLNDFLTESKKDIPLKPIKFILTKEQAPSINLLQKKTNIKLNDSSDTNGGRWNKDEQRRFAEAVLKYGNDWKKIQNHIFSRNLTQVRSHAQKFLMKLKENNFVKNKGLDISMSWTKVMNYLRSILSYNELKQVLFSIEQIERKKAGKKKIKKIRKIKIEEKENTEYSDLNNSNNETNEGNMHFFFEEEKDRCKYNIKNKTIVKEEDEEQILKKYIECFNSPSGNITLNTSFEEESFKEKENDNDINDICYKFIDDREINYSNILDNNI